jgi:hypothetical protein
VLLEQAASVSAIKAAVPMDNIFFILFFFLLIANKQPINIH